MKSLKAQRQSKSRSLVGFARAKRVSGQFAALPINARSLIVELARFRGDQSGNFIMAFALVSPIVIGAAGLGIDIGRWELAHKGLQRAADSAAVSASVAYQANIAADLTSQAAAIAATYNFTTGSGAKITVNRPPLSGTNTTNTNAVEVIISQPQASLFSGLYGLSSVSESGRAVAIGGSKACVLALDSTATAAISAQGSVNVAATGCSIYSDSNSSTSVNAGGSAKISALQIGAVGTVSGQTNMTTVNGIVNNGSVIADPYAGVPMPSYSGCNANKFTAKSTITIYPGVYCNGFTLDAGANVTMAPGIYIMDRGSMTINGSASLTGSGVTIVFTSSTGSNYATAKIAGGANVSLTAPTSGPTAGIVLFGDRSMPVGTSFLLGGGSSQSLGGATYLPEAAISYAGGASAFNGCAQVIGDTISFAGGSHLALNCAGSGTKDIGRAAQLLE